jgi:hypothetical protein
MHSLHYWDSLEWKIGTDSTGTASLDDALLLFSAQKSVEKGERLTSVVVWNVVPWNPLQGYYLCYSLFREFSNCCPVQ